MFKKGFTSFGETQRKKLSGRPEMILLVAVAQHPCLQDAVIWSPRTAFWFPL